MRNLPASLVWLASFFMYFNAAATNSCIAPTHPLAGPLELSKHQCEDTKMSQACQNLYKEIAEAGAQPEEKALRCDIENDLSTNQKLAVSYISCLKGGIVDGLVAPIQMLGTWLGESAAKAVVSLKKDAERQQYCDQHAEMKEKIYQSYNQGVPTLLKLSIPKNLSQKSCAQIETDLYHESKLVRRRVSAATDHKQFQKNASLTPAEKEYLTHTFGAPDLATSSELSLSKTADQLLEAYNIRTDCYNLETRMALRCEILFHVATAGLAVTKTSLSALSGLRVSRFTKEVTSTLRQEGSLRNLNEAQKTSLLLKATTLNNDERISAASSLLGRSLSNSESKALIDAHSIGLNKGTRSYSRTELSQKADKLKSAGFSQEERELLMRSGVTGEFDDYVKASDLAKKAEQGAIARLTELEKREIRIRSELKATTLSDQKRQALEKELETIAKETQSLRDKHFFGDVIGPGTGPVDLARLERQIGFKTREIEVLEANKVPATTLYESRSKSLREAAEFRAMGGQIQDAQKHYALAADDIATAVQQKGLSNFQDKVSALRTLQISGAQKHRDAYETLLRQIAESPQVKNQSVQIKSLEFPYPTSNAAVLNSQKNGTWDLARKVHEQSARIELQRVRNEITAGSKWEQNSRLNREFESLLAEREKLENALVQNLKAQDRSGNGSTIQKKLKELIP